MTQILPSTSGLLRAISVDESTGNAVVPDSVSGGLKTTLQAYQPSTLSYKKLQLDASGNLSVTGGGGGGAVTIADGADVAEGATTDTAITSDANGTVSGKLRGLVKIFADVWDTVNHGLKVNVVAGGAGGGVAQTQVRSAGNAWTDVGYAGGDLNMPVAVQTDISTYAVVSAGNSTTTPLTANSTFTGTSVDMLNYSTIRISLYADQPSSNNGFQVQFSNDNTNWDFVRQSTFLNNGASESSAFNRVARYARVVYTNSGTNQTVFRLQTLLSPNSSEFVRHFMDEAPAGSDTGIMTQSVIVGKTTGGGGGYVNVKVNPSGTLTVADSNMDVALSTRLKPADTLAGVTTVNAVTSITNPLPSGTNLMGKVGIDQTTPGTTNKVTVGSDVVHTIVDSGSITANAGTNLNTSLLALESGGNLATLVTRTPAQGQAAMSASSPVVIASNQSSIPVSATFPASATIGITGLSDSDVIPVQRQPVVDHTGAMGVSGDMLDEIKRSLQSIERILMAMHLTISESYSGVYIDPLQDVDEFIEQ